MKRYFPFVQEDDWECFRRAKKSTGRNLGLGSLQTPGNPSASEWSNSERWCDLIRKCGRDVSFLPIPKLRDLTFLRMSDGTRKHFRVLATLKRLQKCPISDVNYCRIFETVLAPSRQPKSLMAQSIRWSDGNGSLFKSRKIVACGKVIDCERDQR